LSGAARTLEATIMDYPYEDDDMGDYCCRIEKMSNGYEVEIKDPAIVRANSKRDNSKGPYVPYKDPMRSFVFKTTAEVVAFLTKNLDKAMPDDEFDSSFDAAVSESEDEGDD
jgi:hypothetical protein